MSGAKSSNTVSHSHVRRRHPSQRFMRSTSHHDTQAVSGKSKAVSPFAFHAKKRLKTTT